MLFSSIVQETKDVVRYIVFQGGNSALKKGCVQEATSAKMFHIEYFKKC